MATTITALGTVPQKIVDALGAALTQTTMTTLVTFDTHGSETIGFQLTYTKHSETNLSFSVEVQIRETGEWFVVPATLTAAQPVYTATTSTAFEVYVGRHVSQMRIRANTTGAPGANARLEVWGMLSGSTYPIIGGAY